MHVISVIMPRQGQSVESCVITKWHKRAGDSVTPGELLFSYETDKAAFDEEAKCGGILLTIIRGEGDDVPCLEPVCVIGEAGEDAGLSGNNQKERAAAGGPSPDELLSNEPPQNKPSSSELSLSELPPDGRLPMDVLPQATIGNLLPAEQNDGKVFSYERAELKISPRARTLAEKSGADLSFVAASGPDGRVIARDVQALIDAGKIITKAAQGAAAQGLQGTGLGGRVSIRDAARLEAESVLAKKNPAVQDDAAKADAENDLIKNKIAVQEKPIEFPIKGAMPEEFIPSYRDEPLTKIRKIIAATMFASVSTMAQLTHTATYDATNVVALRKQFKEMGKPFGMDGVTLGDLIIYGVVRTLTQPEHAHLNAHFLGDTIRCFADVHLGLAVDTPRGLMVPTVRYANRKTLLELSREIKLLSAACRTGAVDPDLLAGASFTVSNLGAYEVEHFTPIINPPQTGVLGVNTIQQRVREKEGRIEIYPAMSLSLTYDHRALDGAPASAFLRDLKRNLENIQMLLGGGAYGV